MPFRASTPFLQAVIAGEAELYFSVSMPFRASTPFLQNTLSYVNTSSIIVSMPSRAKAPFLRYPFKNLGFMRFLEPVFAGIYQNILTMTIFCAC